MAPNQPWRHVRMALKLPLRGIITALVTPFTTEGKLDQQSVREIVEFQLEHGISGFFACGTTGLGPAMEAGDRKKVAEIVIEETRKRVPVIVQVGAANPQTSFELAAHAESVGADAIASLTPFYYKLGDDAIVEYFKRLSKSTTLPVFVYNIPRHTGNNVDANLLLRLSEIQRIVGVKDSSQDFTQLIDYFSVLPQSFNIIVGTDSFLFSALYAGAQGGVSALANAFPELMIEMYRAFEGREAEKGARLQRQVHALRSAVSKPPIAPLLEILRLRGLKSGQVRSPLRSMTTKEIEELRSSVQRILPELKLAP
jgi:4-hydroxy-tetrahydrodipicolinate synthase